MVREVSAEVYGIPFKSYAIPLKENGRVVGCLMIAKSIEVIKKTKNAMGDLSQEMSQITDTVNHITAVSQNSRKNKHLQQWK